MSDADGDAITKYQFWDSTPHALSGYFVVAGVAQGASQNIDVTAAQLSSTTFQSGSGSDDLWARAFDGIEWDDWKEIPRQCAPQSCPGGDGSRLYGVDA